MNNINTATKKLALKEFINTFPISIPLL